MTYDLLLSGGHVIDPASGRDGPADIAFAGGRVALVADRIDPAGAREHHRVAGRYVVPGLIDLHTHVYPGATPLGVDPDLLLRRSGMTTAVDTGSAGAGNIRGLFELIDDRVTTRVLAFVNIGYAGIIGGLRDCPMPEAEDLRLLNVAACAAAVRRWAPRAVGVKVRVGRSSTGILGAMPLHMAIRASEEAGDVPVMAHIGAEMPPRLEEILDPLRRGDILTHCCTPKGNSLLDHEGRLRDCAAAAKARGVVFDVGHGTGSFGFDTARRMMELGCVPDVISSDVHGGCIDGPVFDVLVTMSKFLCLGMPLAEVIRRVTVAPAAAIRRPELGTLLPGAPGEAAVLELRRGPTAYRDSIGATLQGDQALVCAGVVVGGRLLS